MSMKEIRQRLHIGDVVRIDLGAGLHSYACVAESPNFAFYDVFTSDELSAEEILAHKILFVIGVMSKTIKRGRWKIIGKISDLNAIPRTPHKFIQDKTDPKKFRLYYDGQMRPATRAECEGLEAATVWSPTHVEDRLRDYHAGRPNKWVESLRIKYL